MSTPPQTQMSKLGGRSRRAITMVLALVVGAVGGAVLTSQGDHSSDVSFPTKALLGMSAPAGTWNQRVSEVGPGLEARRIFVGSFTGSLSLATTACNAGMRPVLSFKEGGYSWADIAAGRADAQLQALHTRLVALPCAVYATIHHEPSSGASNHLAGENGTAAQYASAMAHAFPILGGTIIDPEVQVGPIGNGWWWNAKGGLTDAERKTWISPDVLAASDFVGSDTYQGKTTAEGVASKIRNMSAWAKRVNTADPLSVRSLGLGEWNVQSAQAVTDACNALAADPLFAFGNLWNNNGTGSANAHILTGAMLSAFKDCLANW